MVDAKVLNLTVQSFTANKLIIKVENRSGALDKPLALEITFPKYLLDKRIRDAVDLAPLTSGGVYVDVVTGVENKFTVWAQPENSTHFFDLLLANDLDKKGVEITPMILPAGVEFSIHIPLDPNADRVGLINLPYGYKYDTLARVDGEFDLKGDESDWTPDVTFMTDQPTPTMIKPMKDVKISWHIKDGVRAVIRGPLPGGNSEWWLSNSTSSEFKMSDGVFQIKAVGPMTYMLQAEVKGPAGKPNMQVVRMLSLDIAVADKFGYLSVRPERILPYGMVEIDWAAWGCLIARIEVGDYGRGIPLTDKSVSGFYQGSGIVRTTARKSDDKVGVSLTVEMPNESPVLAAEKNFKVINWKPTGMSSFTGKPIGLAVAIPKIALLTTNGLWIATVGETDFSGSSGNLDLKQATTTTPKAWLALAAFINNFVALRQTADDDLQVALYGRDGKPDEILPLDLPPELRPLMVSSAKVFDLAAYGQRVYVIIEASLRTARVRRAFSVSFNSVTKKAEQRSEPLLESMPGYRLVTFDDVLYAVSRDSGHMIRFGLTTAGKLEPYKAARAVDQNGSSMVKEGLLVPVGRLLAVLSPSSVPSLASLAHVGFQNVLKYENLTPLRSQGAEPQDLVYNPQSDRWSRCGHGLDVKEGVVAFRGGESPRLWLVDPNGAAHTLTVLSEHLFLHDYVTNLPSLKLDPVLDKTRKFTLVNSTGMQFVALNDTCFRAGLTALSATSPVEMTPPVINLGPNPKAEFELSYSQEDLPTTTLRFLMQRPAGIRNEYFLELTISGPDLSTATTVFKRIAVDGSIAEVPGTLRQHSTAGPIEVVAKPLVAGITLHIANATPYSLWLRSPDARDEAAREQPYPPTGLRITHSSTPFSIYAHGAGELSFEVDFALPHGVEVTRGNEQQSIRIRVKDKSTGLRIETPNWQETSTGDSYSLTLRYGPDSPLAGVYLGDGVPTKNGDYLYVPLASPARPDFAEVWKMDANTLAPAKSINVTCNGVFAVPNTIAVSADRVLEALRNNNWVNTYDYDLNKKDGAPADWHDVVTNLKASRNDIKYFTLGMKQISSSPPRYSYSYTKHNLTSYDAEQEMTLDHLKGFRPARVPGAPAWVSPETISPMDVSGDNVVICVEGGVFFINVKTKNVMEIRLDGVGREEAVLIDPTEAAVYCAHNRMDNQGLSITRINSASPAIRSTMHIPTTVAYMVEDTNRVSGPNLRYNRPRAVSMITINDRLFVSHGTRIYVLDKTTLVTRSYATLDLPCRLIQVRLGKPPGETHPKYGAPKDCYFAWAIGSMYVGDGRSRNKYQTKLYKIAILP
jgi:hypothetical protein